MKTCNFRAYPEFWRGLENEMGVTPEDLIEVKSIVTALGYLTRSSVATIRTNKKVSALENEYMKMRSNVTKFETVCARFPHLKAIDSFSTGLITILNGIVVHLNRNLFEFEDEKILVNKILEQGRKVYNLLNNRLIPLVKRNLLIFSMSFVLKVCSSLNEGHILITKTSLGLQCQLCCVECSTLVKLSSSRNASTGKNSFSVYNFSRHLTKVHNENSLNQSNSVPNQEFLERNYMRNSNETQYSESMQLTECIRNVSAVTSTPKRAQTHHDFNVQQKDVGSKLFECAECAGLKKQIEECLEAMTECKNLLHKSQHDTEEMKNELKKKGK